VQNRTDKSRENQTKAAENQLSQKNEGKKAAFSFVDNRLEAQQLAEMQLMVNNSAQAQHLRAMQEMADYSPQARNLSGMQALADGNHRVPSQRPQTGNVSGPAHESPETLEEGEFDLKADSAPVQRQAAFEEEQLNQGEFAPVRTQANFEENEPLQGGFATGATPAQLQGETGSQKNDAPSAPNHDKLTPLGGYGLEGIGYSTMTSEAYADWQDTIQCKMGLHGAASYGGITVVTQFLDPAETTQLAGFIPTWLKGSLIIAEALLAIGAGVALTTITGGTAVLPGALAIGIGVVKLVRGILTIIGGDNPSPLQLVLIDSIRILEAAMAIVAGAAAATVNPAVLAFGLTKAIRAVLTAITDYMGANTNFPLRRKVLMGVSTVLHALEVVALAAAGGLLIKSGAASNIAAEAGRDNKIVAGALVIGTAVSKIPRAADQGVATYNAPGGGPPPAVGPLVAAPQAVGPQAVGPQAVAPQGGPLPGSTGVGHLPPSTDEPESSSSEVVLAPPATDEPVLVSPSTSEEETETPPAVTVPLEPTAVGFAPK